MLGGAGLYSSRIAFSSYFQTPTPTLASGGGASVGAGPPQIPDFHAAQPDQLVPQAWPLTQPVYANLADLQQPASAAAAGRLRRPSSFVGDEEDMRALLAAAGLLTTTTPCTNARAHDAATEQTQPQPSTSSDDDGKLARLAVHGWFASDRSAINYCTCLDDDRGFQKRVNLC